MPVGFGLNLLALAAATEGPNLLAGRQLEQENQLEKPVDEAQARRRLAIDIECKYLTSPSDDDAWCQDSQKYVCKLKQVVGYSSGSSNGTCARFFISKNYKNSCPSGSRSISTESECLEASQSFFGSPQQLYLSGGSTKPSGCIVKDGKNDMRFNTHTVGANGNRLKPWSKVCHHIGTISGATVSRTDETARSKAGTVAFTFTLPSVLTSAADIVITFPNTFDVESATIALDGVAGLSNTPGTVSITSKNNHTVVITRGGGADDSNAGDELTVTLSGIKNPVAAGTSGDIQIATRDNSDRDLAIGGTASFTVDATPIDVYKEIIDDWDWENIRQDPIVSACNEHTDAGNKAGVTLVTAVPLKRGNKYYYYFHAISYFGEPIKQIDINVDRRAVYNHVHPFTNRGCIGKICFVENVHLYRAGYVGTYMGGNITAEYANGHWLMGNEKGVADDAIKIVEFIAGPYNADEKIQFTVNGGETGEATVSIDGSGKRGDKCHREELKREPGKPYYFVPQLDEVAQAAQEAPPKKMSEDFVVATYNTFGIENKPFLDEPKETARRFILIGKYVKSINPDIIGFTEVFENYQVNILLEMLPDHCRHFHASTITKPFLNGGLLICSKYPIVEQGAKPFPRISEFSGMELEESFAQKEVLFATVETQWENGEKHRIQVFLAHTLSTNASDSEIYAVERSKQFQVIRELMQARHLLTRLLLGPVTQQILMGDLNVDAVPSSKSCNVDDGKTHRLNLLEYKYNINWLLNGNTKNLNNLDANTDVKLQDPVYGPKKFPVTSHGDVEGCPTTWNTKNTWNIAAGDGDKHSQYLDYILFTDQETYALSDSFFHDTFSLENITIGNPESAMDIYYKHRKSTTITEQKELSDHRPLIYTWRSKLCTTPANLAEQGYVEATSPTPVRKQDSFNVVLTCAAGFTGSSPVATACAPTGGDYKPAGCFAECRDGMSLCDDGINCVSDDERCDANFDCLDESDEKHCPWEIDPDADA